jgi:hypothetical protein
MRYFPAGSLATPSFSSRVNSPFSPPAANSGHDGYVANIFQKSGNKNLAVEANTMTEGKDAAILDTFALALFKNGKVEQAIKAQTEALKLAAGNEQMEKEFRARLDEFTRAAKQQ